MEIQEYVLRGTIEGMVEMLKKDFDMTYEEAKFVIYFFASTNESPNIPKEELDLWYLNNQETYNGQILNKHYAISFTNVKQALLHKAYIFLIQFIFRRNIDLILLGADLIYIICSAIQKIEDFDYCVFARIIEYNIINKNHMFKSSDIVTANQEGKCDNQESDWKCEHFEKDDDCTNNNSKIQLSLDKLAKQKIIKKTGDYWMLL